MCSPYARGGWQTGHKFITIENVLNQGVDNTPPPAPTRRRLSEAGERVLELVRQYDAPVSVDELAERLGKHTNTVREQLNALINTGLVHRQRGEKHGRGRPAWYYVATGAQEAGREVVGLASALAGQIERNSDDPHAEAVAAGESWGSQLLAQGDDLQRSVFWVLDELGFAPQLDGLAGRMSLHACPMAEVAKEHPVVTCGVHRGVIRGVVRQLGGDPDAAELFARHEPEVCLLTVSSQQTDDSCDCG